MIYTAYSKAAYRALLKGVDPEMVCASLKRLLARKGHSGLYPRILRDLYRALTKNQAQRVVQVSVARERDIARFAAQIKAYTARIGADQHSIVHTTDPTLIGGFTVETPSTRLDRSFKHALLALYRSLTA